MAIYDHSEEHEILYGTNTEECIKVEGIVNAFDKIYDYVYSIDRNYLYAFHCYDAIPLGDKSADEAVASMLNAIAPYYVVTCGDYKYSTDVSKDFSLNKELVKESSVKVILQDIFKKYENTEIDNAIDTTLNELEKYINTKNAKLYRIGNDSEFYNESSVYYPMFIGVQYFMIVDGYCILIIYGTCE